MCFKIKLHRLSNKQPSASSSLFPRDRDSQGFGELKRDATDAGKTALP